MVNGNPMLAPSPSALLLSTAPAKPVGRSGGRADWQDAAGFAALLAGQPPQAPSPAGRTVAAEPDGAPAPVVSGALQPGGFDAAVVGQDVPRPARLAVFRLAPPRGEGERDRGTAPGPQSWG